MRLGFLSIVFLFIAFSQSTFSQDFFPLEVGNRWDYGYSGVSFGPTYSYGEYSLIITDKIKLSNDKEYYVFSASIFGDYNLLRVENDSLYAFSTTDSTDCLVLVFNTDSKEKYVTCCYKTVQTMNIDSLDTFHSPDRQINISFSNSTASNNSFNFSQNWGLIYKESWSYLYESYTDLEGCIISGVTYGTLIDVVTNPSSPEFFQLYQNYPNPFNPSTIISYKLPAESKVNLTLYNALGQLVKVLVNEFQNAGSHSINLNAEDLSNGVYFYQLNSGKQVQTRKLVVLK